jgi:uncharacterized repeat protein (TIGR02543 family)
MFSFGIKRTQMRLRLKTTHVVVAVLLGSLLVPVAGITTPQSLPTANAAVSNGSISVPNSGALRINWAQNLSLLGVTFETYVNFTTIAGRNGIFASCYQASPSVNGDGTACQAWGQALRLTWSNSGAFQLAVNDYNGDPGCTINSSAPATNTWYHIALSVPTAANLVNVPSLLFVDGKEVGRCNFVMRTEQVGIRSVALGGDGNSAGVSKMNFGPTRISNFQRYTSEFSPLQIFPTTGDSYAWAVLNTPFDPDNSVSCQTVSDQNNRGVAVSTFSHLDLFWANSSGRTGGGTGVANLACSNSAPPVPVPFFTYANSTIVATRGVAITPRIASSTGGTIDSYAVQPLLPTGLLLNSTTGEISGTPTAPSQTATYVVTATQNGTGATKTVNVTITVSNPVTTLVINDLVNAAQVGRVETLTATATPVAGAVAFSTDQGPIPGCESVPTSTSAPFVAQCPWNPTSAYYILSASFTATDSANYTSSTAPSKTNVRGSLSLTSTGTTTYPSVGQSLNTNNTLRLNFPSGTGLITAQSFTIETWVKVNSSVLNMDISAFYGNSFYGDRGQGISITNSDSRIYNFLDASAVGLVTPTVPIAANNSWQNIVYQRKYVQGSASQSYDAVFVNGVLVTQFANGGYMVAYDPSSTNKSSGVRIGPFNGDVQIGPTQVLSGVAAYPLSGFSPSTTYAFGSNTLALFQPSPTACTSAAVSPLSVTATHGASTSQCSGGPGGFPVALPYVTSVDANRGPLAGANVVTVSGSNFLNVSGVKFGTLSATNVTVNAYGTQLTATVPASVSLGDVSVTVTTAAGTSPPVSGSTYTYLPLPTITNLNPTVGDAVGNNSVVITGTGFTNASAVLFGSKPATSFTVNSSSRITAISPPGTGTVGVQVTAPGGTTVASNFTYSAATSVNSITPNSGSTGGNTTVEITGTNFTAATAVKFDTQNASSFTVVNSTKIIAVSPAGSAATVGVTVVVGGIDYTLSSAYTYTATVEVTAISVASGPTTGGTEVQISGTNFTSASTVVFGTTAATNVSYDSGTGKLTATSPAGTGTVNVRVTTGAAPQSATATANQFIYYAPPTITGLSRSTGPNGGGSSVIITGTNFTSASTVAFGSNNVSTFTINSTTQITATSPTGTGAVDVRVSNQGGTSENVDADNFTYFPVPVVTSISPSTGTTAGGTSVTITGENFTSATGVKFGTADGTSVTVVSATQITVVAPAGTGEVNVSVITPGGTSAIALYGKFTYVSVPTITSISPSSGMLTGGQEVIIDGTGLDNLLITGGVLFGSIAAQSVTVNSSTQIRVITPATSTLGDIDIFVVNASGSSVASSASKFTYTKSNDAKLSALILTQATLVGGFSPTTDSYTSSVVNSVDKVTVTPTVNQANATVQVKIGSGDFATVVSGSASADLPLVVGANTISVKVTAHDETTVITYTITLTRLSNVATLSAASIKGQSATVGTAGTALGSLVAGSITLTTAQATGTGATTFTKTDAGATITKIAKLSSGTEENLTNFDAATALTNSATTTVTNYDFFIVKITAADGTVNYSRFNVTVNSDVASLSGATIKGQTPTLGTPNATLGSETPGAITLTTAQATGVDTTTFTKTDTNAVISRIVKYASGASTSNFESDAAFTNGGAATVTSGDFFIVKVTAADATVMFYRVDVTVNSNVATLSGATIKGLTGTVGTAGTSLGSLTAGSVILSVSQATDNAATTFTITDAGATITKIAKLASGTAENLTNFNAAAAFTNGSTGTVSNGDFFIIQVTAADGTVNYSRVNSVFATNPTVPLSLSATAQAGGANLSWSAPTSNGGSALTGYLIQASTDSTTWTEVGTTNVSTRQLSVTSLLNGTAYVYRVRATNSSGDLNYNWATSASVRSFYLVECSTSGSFYVNSTLSVVQIPSAAGINCMGEVTIPQGIVQVNSNAFTVNTETTNRNITKVTFPSTGLRTIDQGAFKNLGLTSVSIPGTVETVGIYSFMNNYITTVFVTGTGPANHPTALLDSAFKGNPISPGIALTLGSGKIQIGENFGTGTVFSSVDWGTGITSVGRRAFYNVAAGSWAPLFPRTITQFDAQAFEGTGIKTIRFGTATTHSVTSINTSAFDPSINSVQYCGSTGTVLSNYINSRFTSKTIWCAEVVPNAPTGLTAAAGASGQIVLNWTKGASLNEAPTDGFEIRYSSNGGSTWSELIQAAATATSAIVPNLSNGTAYVFQIRAKNLFGNSAYSADASGTPLGAQTNPTFGPSTSTADGFTVNVTNYDATYTYGVPQFTVGSGNISVGTATGSNLPITVTGMTPGSVATFSIGNQKTGFSSGTGLASGSALNAAKVPVVGSIVTLTGGFTASVTNYDSAYQWNVSSTVGTAVINTQGGITVSGVNPSTAVELTVSTTRVGYAPGSSKTTVTTLALLKVFYNGTRSTGGAAPTDANSYASNASAVVLANPTSGGLTLNGYYLAGWSLNSDETGQVYQPGASLALGLVDVTLYAKWTLTPYTVSYNANGSTGGSVPVDSNTYTIGGSVPILGNTGTLVRTGYSFIGWGLSSTDTVNQYVSGNTYTVGTSNIAFWARWSPNTYKVTFDANGGTGSPSKAEDNYTTAGTAVPLATRGTLEKSGYNFAGWGLSAVSTLVADPFTTTSTVELYAQWTVANFAVTYVAGTYGSGTVPTQANVNYGTSFTVATATGLTGSDGTDPFAFVSWSDGTKTYAPGQSILMGAGAVTLTAQWTRIYNVKYSFNGGSVATPIADQQKIAGQTIVVSSTVPTRAGYDFVTWKDQSGEEATAGTNYQVRDNHYLLYAQWTPKSYTITYDVNGGNSTVPTQVNRTIGQIFTVAAAPTKIGYDFEHWRDGTNNYNPGADYQVTTDNVVLQAIWTPQVYQISYNFNGGTGTPIAAQNYTFGSGPASLPASGPTRFEYNFTGWATTNTATTPVASSFAPSGNIMLHAVWVTSVYRLTFNAGSGMSDTATATVTIGQSVSLPNATRANYTLQGWSTTETGGTLISLSGPYTPTSDATLYAQWVPAVFTVTYNGNSGTAGRATDSINYNSQTPIVLPSASRTNYVFSGWYSQASGGYLLGEAGVNFLPTGSVTAYARWVQGSLSGMGPSTLIAQITVRDGIDTGFTAGSNGSTATVSYTAGALPDGTVITAYLENSTTRVTSLLQTPATPILSLILAWVAPDGTVPDTVAGKPIIMTVSNSSITAGSKVYGLVGNQPEILGVALVDGQVQVSITKDPVVVVAMVAPDAPTGVTATPIDTTSATISWTAPANNGGTAITKYVATAGAGKSCESLSATTCVIDGLVTGTPYTFTVTASNLIGNSAASALSSPLTLGAPSSGNTGGGSSGGSSGGAPAPSLPVPVVSTPGTEAKVAAEKAAADAKAAAELKAAADKAAAEAAAAAALKAAQEIADAEARAAAELKAAQDKAAEDARIAAELKAAQEKADAELKAAAEKKALDDAKAAAALAAKKIVPKITLYSISSKLTLSAYDNAYLKKYISTLKPKAPVTCIGYYYTKNTTVAKAKTLATAQAKAICSMIKKAKPSVITAIALYPSTKAPLAAKGAKWVAVSYRVDSYNKR